MHVSISLQITIKDKPKHYLGLTQENYVIGKEKEVLLADAILAMSHCVVNLYGHCYPLEDLNAELQRAAELLKEQVIYDEG